LTVGNEKPKAGETEPAVQSPTVDHKPSTANKELGFISPVVAKIAAEHGVNLQEVKGTGLNGRITKNDVLAFVESGKKKIEHTFHADFNARSYPNRWR
jgi:pyruvate/2-oxoglutarate dehydrogenase complex dihydrolipoamide acyltransferase (E2) component